MTERNERRARLAYDTFRKGFSSRNLRPPAWDGVEPWIRDAMRVAYLQGLLDGKSAAALQNDPRPQL